MYEILKLPLVKLITPEGIIEKISTLIRMIQEDVKFRQIPPAQNDI